MNCSKTSVKYLIHQDVCENYLAYLSGYTTIFKILTQDSQKC